LGGEKAFMGKLLIGSTECLWYRSRGNFQRFVKSATKKSSERGDRCRMRNERVQEGRKKFQTQVGCRRWIIMGVFERKKNGIRTRNKKGKKTSGRQLLKRES